MAIDLSQATGSQLRVTPTPPLETLGSIFGCHTEVGGVLLASSG